jgi:hypothetical protein
VRSSTSNSEIKVLRADWLRTWATTAALTLLLLAGWETFWRVKGFQPTINDDARLWAAVRREVRPESTVLIGSSLMHAGVHPSIFREVTGTTPIQLSVNGGRSYLLLENLARDPAFRGTVICELIEGEVIDWVTTSTEKSFISNYEQERLAERSESFLQRFLRERFAFTSPQLSLQTLIRGVLHGQLPVPLHIHFQIGEDRSLYVDFMKVDIEKFRAKVAAAPYSQGPGISPEEFVARARRFEVLAAEIERRGGRVVFVRPPFSGVAWERQEKAYPKAAYWDEFARRTHFQTIHFKDYPELQIECPDYVHLDMRDAPRFTRALAKIIFEKR